MGKVSESDFIKSLLEQVVCWWLCWVWSKLSIVWFLLESCYITLFFIITSSTLYIAFNWSWGWWSIFHLFFNSRIEERLLWFTMSAHVQICFTLRCCTFLLHSLGQFFVCPLVYILKTFVLVTMTGRCFWKILRSRWCRVLNKRIIGRLLTTCFFTSL